MRLPLDTHTFLWYVAESPRLSAASIWEMGIKVATGKMEVDGPFEQTILAQLAENSISQLPINVSHVARTIGLPFHHRDPFDRIIAAQCLTEGIGLVSLDPIFDSYGVNRMW